MTTLGYWQNRGVAQPIRYLLAYMNVQYTEKHYSGDGDQWFNQDKLQLQSNFPNLPYYIDGDFVLTETNAIPTYLIRKHKQHELLGSNPDGSFTQKEATVLQILGVLYEYRGLIFSSIKQPNFQAEKQNLYNDKFSVFIERLEKQLGTQEFLVGSLSYADFVLYDMLIYLKWIYPQVAVLTDYIQRVENIPQIKQYLSSPNAMLHFMPSNFKIQIYV